MENFRPQDNWTTSAATSKVVNIHMYIAGAYFLGFIVFGGAALAGSKTSSSAFEVAFPWLILMMSVMHYQTSKAVDKERRWALNVSEILALPLFFGFPIGTALCFYLLKNLRVLRKQSKR